jgi:hypothetical protein
LNRDFVPRVRIDSSTPFQVPYFDLSLEMGLCFLVFSLVFYTFWSMLNWF